MMCVVILAIVMLSAVVPHPPNFHVVTFLEKIRFLNAPASYIYARVVSYLSGLGMLISYRLPVQMRTTFGRISLLNDNNFSA
jgi:hypothetical protein